MTRSNKDFIKIPDDDNEFDLEDDEVDDDLDEELDDLDEEDLLGR